MLPQRIDRKIVEQAMGPADQVKERGAIYEELLGFVPPRIEARLSVTGALDPTMVEIQERMREHAMYPKCFDVKTAQLSAYGGKISADGTKCTTYADCLALIKSGSEIRYKGPSGIGPIDDQNDPSSAFIGIYKFDANNKDILSGTVEGSKS